MYVHVIALFVFVLFIPKPAESTGFRDDTLVDNTHGKEIVESVLRKIASSQIFPKDHSFLIRLAYIESRFGTNSSTYRAGYYGGIWQVDQARFSSTKSSSLISIHNQIQAKFNIKWSHVTWRNLLKPFYSGLAAAIYFQSLKQPIPGRIDFQANHWKTFYRPAGNTRKFIEASDQLQKSRVCRGKLDLCIVLDSSGSINRVDYNKALQFTSSLIGSFTTDFARIGLLVYSNNVVEIFHLDSGLTIQQMQTKAQSAVHISSGTATDLAIREAVKLFQKARRLNDVPKIMAVFTDGYSNDKKATLDAVQISKKAGIRSLAVGIGSSIDPTELKAIALNETEATFQVTDFDALKDFLYTLTELTCDIPQKPVVDKPYTDSLVRDERRRYEFEVPQDGIVLKVTQTRGRVQGYWAWNETVPSEAVHDGEIVGTTYLFPRNDMSLTEPVFVSMKGLEKINNYALVAASDCTEGHTARVTTPTTTTRATTTTSTTPTTTTRATTTTSTTTTTAKRVVATTEASTTTTEKSEGMLITGERNHVNHTNSARIAILGENSTDEEIKEFASKARNLKEGFNITYINATFSQKLAAGNSTVTDLLSHNAGGVAEITNLVYFAGVCTIMTNF